MIPVLCGSSGLARPGRVPPGREPLFDYCSPIDETSAEGFPYGRACENFHPVSSVKPLMAYDQWRGDWNARLTLST